MTGGAGASGPVQVFVDLTRFAATATRAQLRDRVRELEDVGATEEFDALGLAMPTFRTRIDRLAEVLAVTRGLWTDGTVTYDGDHLVACDLPMSPVPDHPPLLLVGGGSDRLLGLAGRFADLLDLHGDPKHGRVTGATMAQASAGDVARRARTTVDDLAGRIGLVRDAAEAAGEPWCRTPEVCVDGQPAT